MGTQLQQRAYRKATHLDGWVYLGGKMRKITIKNLSISGALAVLIPENLHVGNDHQQTLKNLSLSKTLDFFLPPLRLSGIAKVVRITITENLQVSFAMAFQELNHSEDKPCFNRKNYRAKITIPGKLFLNGYYFDFMTVNMSVDGLMIRLPIVFGVEQGMVVAFKFPHANLKGQATVIWTMDNENCETLIGLQHIAPDNPVGGYPAPLDVSDNHLEPVGQRRGDTCPPYLFCGKTWANQLSEPQKMRQW
ncbi:PilZ domain-containing protein [Methylovulum psychrotolerans]|uniref:PilZ domain-containing protein n=1 Tax=Methylovulum psychrotolerans TaxID=1704499 RepID=A0A2S5CGB3_9GAMM|nr:PilZ domain-containing protein [Methylovulum psychrotolerans]POZ49848.1 PilZ domain-containing protein [Methylovulum psychrotolerans]